MTESEKSYHKTVMEDFKAMAQEKYPVSLGNNELHTRLFDVEQSHASLMRQANRSDIDRNRACMIENMGRYADMRLQLFSELFRILSFRAQYAKFHLEGINVDKEATLKSIEECNNTIKQILGL